MRFMLWKVLRKGSLFVALFCICQFADAQAPDYIYYFNVQLQSVAKDYASIIGKGYKLDKSVLVDYYRMEDNKMILSIEYTDSTLKVDNGIFQSYHDNGLFENNGSFINGKENGLWMKYDSLGRTLDSIVYNMGVEMTYKKQEFYLNEAVKFQECKDSIAGTFSLFLFDSLGGIEAKYEFLAPNKGLLTRYNNGVEKTEPLTSQQRIGAEYVGGAKAWRKFLESTINPGYPIEKKAPAGTYTVIVRFKVNEQGDAVDFFPETHHGYGMEEEVINKLKRGGKWTPATYFGRPTFSIRRQPVTFVVPGD